MSRSSRQWARTIGHVCVLVLLWLGLWGGVSAANVLSGIVVAAFVLTVSPLSPSDDRGIAPLAIARFVAVFAVLLLQSTWAVVAAVASPRRRVHPGLFEYELADDSPVIATVVANAISLTPGTLTVDVRTGTHGALLRVHALDRSDPTALVATASRLERLARAALPGTRQEAR